MAIKSTAQELVGVLFLARDVAHRAHLNTDSYSQHMALGAFYDNIIGLADKFSEAWMGRNKKKIGNIPYMTAPDSEILKQLDSMLSNIIDEVEAEFCSAIYKLKFLK